MGVDGLAAATNQQSAIDGVIPQTPDSAARRAMLSSLAFGVFGAALVVFMLIKVAVPGLFDATPFAGYGRIRALALNSLIYGFAGLAATGLGYYVTPRLAGAPLVGERLANLAAAGYTALVGLGLGAIAIGVGGSNELAEFPLLIDVFVFIAMTVPALLITATLMRRAERTIYVTLWYTLAAAWWLPAIYAVGNLPWVRGIGRQLQSSFLVGSLIGAWIPMVGIGAAYYVIPRATGRPLYSRSLAQAGFWTLAGTGLFASVTRYGSSAAPDWLETTGAVFSLGLAVAAIATIANLAGTVAGAYSQVAESAALRMIAIGTLTYGAVALFLSVQGFRSVDAVVGLTSWYEGLVLTTMLTVAPLLLIGAMAYALPQIAGRRLVDDLARRGIRLTTWGGAITGALLLVAGVTTGLGWTSGAIPNNGAEFFRATAQTDTFYLLAIVSALLAAAGIVLLALTIVRTYTSGEATVTEILVEVETDRE